MPNYKRARLEGYVLRPFKRQPLSAFIAGECHKTEMSFRVEYLPLGHGKGLFCIVREVKLLAPPLKLPPSPEASADATAHRLREPVPLHSSPLSPSLSRPHSPALPNLPASPALPSSSENIRRPS